MLLIAVKETTGAMRYFNDVHVFKMDFLRFINTFRKNLIMTLPPLEQVYS